MEHESKESRGLEYLKSEVRQLLGFDCRKYNDNFLKRRFNVRMRKNRIDSYEEYVLLLRKDTGEREELRKELTIHVTNFFRDKSLWTAFMDDIIPELSNTKQGAGEIRIWSAGCSSGEEPVSIAISLLEKLGVGRRASIIATDYDAETIEKAKRSLYEKNQFKETDPYLQEKYFKEAGDDLYTPVPQVTSLITYKQEDMLTAKPPKVDAIFCRNVVIYFDMEAKKELYCRFFEALKPGGYLILGKTECLNNLRDKFIIVDTKERIYRKAG